MSETRIAVCGHALESATMPINWALVPRRAVDDVLERLNGGASGVALIGNEGVGKTTLAGQVAEGLGRGEPVWVVGTLAQSSVPSSLSHLFSIPRDAAAAAQPYPWLSPDR